MPIYPLGKKKKKKEEKQRIRSQIYQAFLTASAKTVCSVEGKSYWDILQQESMCELQSLQTAVSVNPDTSMPFFGTAKICWCIL